MNYITSCPACETQFLLSKEQLKAHRGKVQCGNCEHIFNAKNRLTEISDDIHSTAEYKASLEQQAENVNQEPAAIADEKPIDEVLNNVLGGVPSLKNLESTENINSAYFDESNIETTIEISDAYDAELIHAPIEIEDLTANASFDGNSSFDRPKNKINIWLVVFSLMLAILAGLQTLYAKRTQIAANYPQYKSLLIQACAAVQCEIALPKNLDLLTIDDSDMQEDEYHQDVIKFTSLLINNANYSQAYPNIELTLTATDDQPVLRRLIKPAEYIKIVNNASTGIAAREEVRINLAFNVKDLEVAGYRVLLLY